MDFLNTASGLARRLGADRIPVLGSGLRRAGRAINRLVYGRVGVPARIDDAVDLRLSPRTFSGGAYAFDPQLTAELVRVARPGQHMLDAGAHMGIASLLYASVAGTGTRVVAFEPNPHAFPLLWENSRVNGMRVECYQMALGLRGGITEFYVSGVDPNASMSQDAPGNYWYWKDKPKPVMERISVGMTSVDAICEALGLRPGFIKLDVEGAELPVLQGAEKVLRECRPLILLETHVFAWPSFGYRREDLAALIASRGYEVLDSTGAAFNGALGEGPEPDNNHYLLRPR
jgi:FkbM family methyltransferase